MSSAAATAKSASTILVIEDYTDTRELLSVLLRRHGYQVVEAEDGLEGLLKAGWVYPDLILMDLSLPEMDGVEVARRIHAQAKLSQVPIFVVSAYLTKEVVDDVRAAGCAEVFSKPFDAVALLDKNRRSAFFQLLRLIQFSIQQRRRIALSSSSCRRERARLLSSWSSRLSCCQLSERRRGASLPQSTLAFSRQIRTGSVATGCLATH